MREIGIFAWFGYPLPLEKRVALIAKAGFDSTCLWLGKEEELVDRGKADRMPAPAQDAGLKIDNVHASFERCNLLWSESKEEHAIIKREYEAAISFCSKHSIGKLVIHVARGASPPPQSNEGLRILRELVSCAEDSGVILALENTTRSDYVDFIFSNLQSSHLGLCYDSSHDFLQGQSRGAILGKWGPLLVTTHLSDNKGKNDDHLLPEDGQIDWSIVADAFPAATYAGPLMLEVYPQDSSALAAEDFLHIAYERAVRLRKVLD
ncbi:MAG: sugar phosphate isomerase/epimerase family protein [Planctomycetota bacterium]|jgi:sugar phosphate isomerase/epimerase